MKKTLQEKVTNEIINIRYKEKECVAAFLSGIIHTSGSLILSSTGIGFEIRNSLEILNRCLKGFNFIFPKSLDCDLEIFKENDEEVLHFKGKDAKGVLKALQILEKDGSINFGISKDVLNHEKLKKAYIAGVFLGCGKIYSPLERSTYFVSFSFAGEDMANDFVSLLEKFDVELKVAPLKEKFLASSKKSETVISVLALCDAMDSYFEMLDLSIERERSQDANRALNCDLGNTDKLIVASVKQVMAIKKISEEMSLNALEDKLYEIAMLRLENEDKSLEELGQMLDPPISKSGVNHRMRKIIKLSESLGGKK